MVPGKTKRPTQRDEGHVEAKEGREQEELSERGPDPFP